MDFTRLEDVPLLGFFARAIGIASGNFTRPNDTNAYASGDLVANNTTAGSVVPVSLTVGRFAAAFGRIKRVRLMKSNATLTNAQFRVHFYTASPTAANGDNGAWSTSQSATYLGSVDITQDKAFTDGAVGVSATTDMFFRAAAGVQTIFALLEARAAYTPAANEVFTITAEIEQD